MSCVKRFLKYPVALVRTVIVIVNNIYCIPTFIIWISFLMPLKMAYPVVYYKVEGILFSWLLSVVSMWSYTAGYDIVELGDDVTPCLEKHTLVLVNHQSTADVPMLMANFESKKGVLENVMWIMDRLFKFTNFGLVSLIRGDFFISSGKDKRDASILALRQHLQHSYIKKDRKWIILFPEGGFLRKRKHISQKFAQKNNLPLLEHVTLPRVGAMKAIMEVLQHSTTDGTNDKKNDAHLSPDIKNYLEYVLDITIAYPNGIPLDLPTIIHGMKDPCHTYMYYRLYKMSELPSEEESLTKWLYERFFEKEQILKKFYETGTFEAAKVPAQVISHDALKFLLVNLFFITSTYIHYQMIRILLTEYFLISRVYIQVS